MARRIAARPQAVASRPRGLRAQLVDALRARAAKLPTESEFYDFGPQRDQLAGRAAALEAGADGQLQRYELPTELRSQYAGAKLFRLVGNELVAEEPERD